ncbi:MAG: hypothetical protein LBK47_03720 [Prevotellaceae bacterium]|jgi:uncharacterized protein (TIGR02145 family)|nr:hypothetical protein [Prevotellaceae bacterium]
MKHVKKIFLLLLAGMAAQGAWAQNHLYAPPLKAYTIESATAATAATDVRYQWYRNGEIIPGTAATHDSYEVPETQAVGRNVEFKRAAYVDGCSERKFSNAIIITFCGLVTPSGLCWADRNVSTPAHFASAADASADYAWYQWNRPDKAWLPSDGGNGVAVTGWNATADQATTWTNGSPCPAGWRLPTMLEYQELDSLSGQYTGGPNGTRGGQWVAANSKGNAVAGRFYGPNATTCSLPDNMVGCVFFPASGYRNTSNGALTSQGANGYGWSSTQYNGTTGYRLNFNSTASTPAGNNSKAYGYPVRCVQ